MKEKRKPSVIGIIFPVLLAGMAVMIAFCEWTITSSGNELRARALETCRAEVGYISDALYSQLTSVQLQNVEILNSDSVLALAMRNAIMDRYETVTNESAVMKQIRSGLSRLNLPDASVQLYIPSIGTVITPQKAAAAAPEEKAEILRIVGDFPKGLYYTPEHMGFWSASPLIRDPSRALESRVMLTQVRRDSLNGLLKRYASHSGNTRLYLTFGSHVIAFSDAVSWEEDIFDGFDGDMKTVAAGDGQYYVIRARHTSSDLAIVAALPVDSVMSNMYRLRGMLRTLEAVCVLILLLAAFSLYRIVCRPLKAMSAALRRAGEGDLAVRMPGEKTAELDGVAATFNGMAERLENLIEKEYKARLLAAGAEKKALQYQISPHFLYNTYFQLRSLILLEENEQAERLADLMGRYLRYIVHQSGASATLGEEMDHARNYADIQSMRFAGRVEVLWEAEDGAWRDTVVPRLIVQPLIENAFGHGLKNMDSGGVIRVSLLARDGEILIGVEDNGDALSSSAPEELRQAVDERRPGWEGVALANIHRRLRLHFGEKSGLAFDRSPLGGLKVTVVIAEGKEKE